MSIHQSRVGYLGPKEATFGYTAARKLFDRPEIVDGFGPFEFEPFVSQPEIPSILARKDIDFGVVAYENALDGAVNDTINRVVAEHKRSGITILAEVQVPIIMCAMRKPGFDGKPIAKVFSHEVALRQCNEYVSKLEKLGACRESCPSTGKAAEIAASDGSVVALATDGAAKKFGLVLIESGSVADYKKNTTNFWVLSFHPALPSKEKTCVLINLVRDKPGGLYRSLGAFANRGLNLATMNKVPIPETIPREYDFLFEVETSLDNHALVDALNELRFNGHCIWETPKVLGSYPVIK